MYRNLRSFLFFSSNLRIYPVPIRTLSKYPNFSIGSFKKHTVITRSATSTMISNHYQISRLYSNLPNYIPVNLPALSPTMEVGTILSWDKNEGDKLNEGDLLAEIETDKATMGLETPEEGYLAKIIIPAGTKDIKVGKLICIIVEDEGDISAFKNYKDDSSDTSSTSMVKKVESIPQLSPPTPVPAAAVVTFTATTLPESIQPTSHKRPGKIFNISPYAHTLASNQNIDLNSIEGTGMFSSIRSRDLKKIQMQQNLIIDTPVPVPVQVIQGISSSNYKDIIVTGIRSTIAKRLVASKQTIPHYYITTEIPMDDTILLRTKFNEQLSKDGLKLSLNDFIIKAAAMACIKIPQINSHWMETYIREYTSVDISVAVNTDRGLITPIIFNSDKKGLIEISKNIKYLAQKAKDGKLMPHEFQGGTFSISNLGMYGLTNFTAIINPPQSCILAVGATHEKLIPATATDDNEKGYIKSTTCYVSLSCDHRVVDGAISAQWLQIFKSYLSNPTTMIL